MLKKILIIIVFLLFEYSLPLYSQCALKEISLSERINMSSVIIEGRVVSSFSFWATDKKRIYTSSKVEVFKIFKGDINGPEVEIITEGGIVGNDMMIASSLLQLKVGEVGIFTCSSTDILPAQTKKNEFISLEVVASKQGFIKYELEKLTASDVFTVYSSIREAYASIKNLTGKSHRTLKEIDFTPLNNHNGRAQPEITSFSPSSITAGTGNVLTINGSGFGLVGAGKVSFANADDGGITTIDVSGSQIKSWSDTQIKAEVPSNAGTGKIRVSNITSTSSTDDLTVIYAVSNVNDAGFSYESRFITQAVGGYVWQMYEGFNSNLFARNAFLKAFTNWRCATFVNWSLGEVSLVNKTEKDDQNIIRFDIGNELPAGVLGLCYSYYSSCSAGIWYLSEFDLLFDDATNWQYGPALPTSTQYDFESIALHELGHGHQLGHVIDPADLMHFAFGGGSHKRILNTSNLQCGIYVMNKSITGEVCNKQPMKALNTTICADPALAIYEFEGLHVNPNPFSSITQISYQFSSKSSVKIELYDVLGKKIATLIDESQEAGKYEQELNGKNYGLIHGTYIIKFTLNGEIHTRKIIHITRQ